MTVFGVKEAQKEVFVHMDASPVLRTSSRKYQPASVKFISTVLIATS